MAKKIAKKTAKKAAAKSAAPKKGKSAAATATAEPKQRASTMTKAERDERCQALIDEWYGSDLEGDERNKLGRSIRGKLRTLDPHWKETYANYIASAWPSGSDDED